MCLAQPGKYLFLTANMIAVSVCKHSQSRCMKIFGHNGPCHHLMARKKYYQTYQWKRPRVSIVVLFLIDTHIIEYLSCRTALLIRSDYWWSNLLWATSALLQHLPVDILKGRRPWTDNLKLISKEILDLEHKTDVREYRYLEMSTTSTDRQSDPLIWITRQM